MSTRSLIASLFTGLFAVAASNLAHANVLTCAQRAKAVTANTGQSIHNARSTVTGDVQAATTILKNGGVITGTQTPNTPAHLTVPATPSGAVNLGNYVVSGAVTLPAGNYVASSFNMNGGSTLTVAGAVQIWVTGGMNLTGTANAGGNPTNLEFLVTGNQSVNVNGNTQLTGVIYAPGAPVTLNAAVTGVVAGSTTTLNSGSSVTFAPGADCTASGQ
jgi:hypothetical protein